MLQPVEHQIYELFRRVMYDSEYSLLAEEFRSKSDILQNEAQKFTPSQWKAMDDYLDAFSKVYHTMLILALEEKPSRKRKK